MCAFSLVIYIPKTFCSHFLKKGSKADDGRCWSVYVKVVTNNVNHYFIYVCSNADFMRKRVRVDEIVV